MEEIIQGSSMDAAQRALKIRNKVYKLQYS